MSEAEAPKLPKPKMSGLLHAQIMRNLTFALINCALAGLYMKFVFGNGRKARYAEFYKNYDAKKEFNRMRVKGLFDSCSPEEELDDD